MKTVEMPKMGDTMEEGKILRWIKHEGDAVKKGESLAEVETDKVNIEIEAFASGVLRKILVPEGNSAPIGAGIALIGAPDEPLPESIAGNGAGSTSTAAGAINRGPAGQAATKTPFASSSPVATLETIPQAAAVTITSAPTPSDTQGRIFISPLARRFAEEQQVDYTRIRGTGPNGRIIKSRAVAGRTANACRGANYSCRSTHAGSTRIHAIR